MKLGMTAAEAAALSASMPASQNAYLGERLKAIIDAAGTIGNILYLDPTNGDDGNDGSLGAGFKTLAKGYAALRDGYNDVLVYIPGSGSISLAAGFTWAKSYAHFVGACAPVQVAQRCRIFTTAGTTGVTAQFTVSGQGCIFQNIYFFHGVADTTASFAVVVSGQRNQFWNCHFAGIGDVTMDVAGAGSLSIAGGAENRFVHCAIGLDTITRTTSTCELAFSLGATRNEFEDCLFTSYIGAAGHALVEILLATGIDRWQIFKGCIFQADSVNRATALTSVFKIPASIVQGMIILKDCMSAAWGATTVWDSNARGATLVGMPTSTAAGAGGLGTIK